MNALESFIAEMCLDPIEAMNRLQDQAIVSDNCVTAGDVADVDCERVIQWLKDNL